VGTVVVALQHFYWQQDGFRQKINVDNSKTNLHKNNKWGEDICFIYCVAAAVAMQCTMVSCKKPASSYSKKPGASKHQHWGVAASNIGAA